MPASLSQVVSTLHQHEAELRRHGVCHAAVFGSVARGESHHDSDIDVLIDLDPHRPVGLFEYSRVRLYISGLLGGSADVVNRKTLRPLLKEPILRGAVNVFQNPAQRLWDIVDNIDAIRAFTADMSFGDFTADRKTVYAVTRALEIISEASRLHRGNGLDRDSSGSQRVPARDEVVDETLVWYTVQHSLTDLHQASAAEVRRLAAAPV